MRKIAVLLIFFVSQSAYPMLERSDVGVKEEFFSAIRARDVVGVQLLLAAKAVDVNVTLEGGETGLYVACEWEVAGIARCLLEHGANVNAPNREGVRPYHQACKARNGVLIELLHSRGVDIKSIARDSGFRGNGLAIAACIGLPENCERILRQAAFELFLDHPVARRGVKELLLVLHRKKVSRHLWCEILKSVVYTVLGVTSHVAIGSSSSEDFFGRLLSVVPFLSEEIVFKVMKKCGFLEELKEFSKGAIELVRRMRIKVTIPLPGYEENEEEKKCALDLFDPTSWKELFAIWMRSKLKKGGHPADQRTYSTLKQSAIAKPLPSHPET